MRHYEHVDRLCEHVEIIGRLSPARHPNNEAQSKSDKKDYPVRNNLDAFKPKVIVRRKREHIPANNSATIGTYETPRDTLGGGTNQESLGADDTLRNLSSTHADVSRETSVSNVSRETYKRGGLLSATELSTGVEADTLDRLQVVEREAWRAYRAERAGQNRPATLMKMLREISDINVKQVSVARHVVRVERAVPVEWERIRDRVITALQNYPEALAAVMAALDEGE